VYVPNIDGKSRPVKKQISSFQKFRGLLTTIQTLDPDVIIHTGDIVDQDITEHKDRVRTLKSRLPDLTQKRLLLYLRGNHDTALSDFHIRELFDDWDILALEDASPVHLAEGQITVVGRDHCKYPTQGVLGMNDLDNESDSIVIGAFHQTIHQISRSYAADTKLTDLTPAGIPATRYYDLLLFGHMHTDYLEQDEKGCTIIDGGSALGLDIASTVGLLTFSEAAAHYQRFPLWVER
jgi:predicted phosphodiesterase